MIELGSLELKVLKLAADGWPIEKIGPLAGTTARNTRTVLERVKDLLGARNITHAVAIGYREGILVDGIDREQVALVREAHEMGYRIALVPKDA